ncbi:hypothetical protein M0R45_034824 [Rubus argutus]|uniref:Uncharacterized protein n=1 Tax=Rubus argutus TaxID=59490 RepID=A0AAW1VV12_RUBAR
MKPWGIPPPEAAPPLCAHTHRAQLAPASSRSSPPSVLKQEERNERWREAGEMKREQDEEEKKEDRARGEKETDGKGNRERKGDGKTNQKEGKRRKREKHGKETARVLHACRSINSREYRRIFDDYEGN